MTRVGPPCIQLLVLYAMPQLSIKMKKYWIPSFSGSTFSLECPSINPQLKIASLAPQNGIIWRKFLFLPSQILISRSFCCFAYIASFNVRKLSLCLSIPAGERGRANTISCHHQVLLTWQWFFIMDCNCSLSSTSTFLFCHCIISHLFFCVCCRDFDTFV